jgi:hypothetical protein
MSASGSIEAPPAKLHAALINVTERLARELAEPTESLPDWSELEWHVVWMP